MRAPPRSRLPSAVIGACMALFVPWLTLQIAARSGHDPSRAMLRGITPLTAQVTAPAPERHRYPDSPWVQALAAEAEHLGVDTAGLTALADALAREVGWWMLAESGRGNLAAAEQVLWEAGKGDRILRRIAQALHDRGLRSDPAPAVLSRLDPRAKRLQLDPDALVFLILHIGRALDLDLYAALSPRMLYVRYQGPTGDTRLFLDPNRIKGPTLPDDAVGRSQARPRSTGATSAALVAATAMDDPRTADDLIDALTTRLVVSLVEAGAPVDAEALLAARIPDTRDHRLVALLHTWRVRHAQAALEEGRPEDAARLAARAILVRRSHGPLHLREQLEENIVMGDAVQSIRRDAASRGALDRAIARGEALAVCEVLRPLGEELGELLPACR